MKRSIIGILSIIAGYALATLLSVALLLVGIDIPAMLAKSSSEYNTYGGVEALLLTIGLSWATYQVLAGRFFEKKVPERPLTESPRVAAAVERQPQAPLADAPSSAQSAYVESVSAANAQLAAVRIGRAQWARPTPLLLALGMALAWGVLSVGPSRLAADIGELIPRDKVTASFCADTLAPPVGNRCSQSDSGTILPHDPRIVYSKPQCFGYGNGVPGPEPDGLCHERSGGDASFLVADVIVVGQNGLLAFLAIGAALLLWPRLRASIPGSQPSPAGLGAPILDLGTSSQPVVGQVETVGDKLRQLAALRDEGLISEEEFAAKKVELLRAL